MVETEDGSARGYYGVLVKDGKPMVGNGTIRDLTCPNDGAPLVPAVNGNVNFGRDTRGVAPLKLFSK